MACRQSGMQFAALPLEHKPFSPASWPISSPQPQQTLCSHSIPERIVRKSLLVPGNYYKEQTVKSRLILVFHRQTAPSVTRKCPSVISSVILY